jgi:hypothetical protein
MGFNKLFLPEVSRLQEHLENLGEEEFGKHWLRRLQKADAIIGSTKSNDFLKPFTDRAYNESNSMLVQNEVITEIKK